MKRKHIYISYTQRATW